MSFLSFVAFEQSSMRRSICCWHACSRSIVFYVIDYSMIEPWRVCLIDLMKSGRKRFLRTTKYPSIIQSMAANDAWGEVEKNKLWNMDGKEREEFGKIAYKKSFTLTPSWPLHLKLALLFGVCRPMTPQHLSENMRSRFRPCTWL